MSSCYRVSFVPRPEQIEARDLKDSLVVYDNRTKSTVALQPPASLVLKTLIEQYAPGEVTSADALFETTSETDLEVALSELEAANLINLHDA
jgi:DNA-binding winged helix-turn-helix (wHTH) protein